MELAKAKRLDKIGSLFPILGAQIAEINEHDRLVTKSREMLIHAGVYSESDFQMLLDRAKKAATETPYRFADCLPRIVMSYINERSASR